MKDIKLVKVKYLPKVLEEGMLYFSKTYGIVAHLCPCGCGNKVVTPIDPTEWQIRIKKNKPTLYPSIGNWQLDCKTHYWIINGEIEWSYKWSDEQIEEGRKYEELVRNKYFDKASHKKRKYAISNIFSWFMRS